MHEVRGDQASRRGRGAKGRDVTNRDLAPIADKIWFCPVHGKREWNQVTKCTVAGDGFEVGALYCLPCFQLAQPTKVVSGSSACPVCGALEPHGCSGLEPTIGRYVIDLDALSDPSVILVRMKDAVLCEEPGLRALLTELRLARAVVEAVRGMRQTIHEEDCKTWTENDDLPLHHNCSCLAGEVVIALAAYDAGTKCST